MLMSRSLWTGFVLLVASQTSWAQSAPPPSAKAEMSKIAKAISTCGAQKEFGTTVDDSGVMYLGQPINVTWDINRVDSVRAPYQAYVEFATPRRFEIPELGLAKHKPGYQAMMQQGAWTQKHRYEFDVTDSGVQLRKMLSFGQSDWIDEQVSSYCFQKAARQQ